MKKYEDAELEVIAFDAEDIITTSDTSSDEEEFEIEDGGSSDFEF